MPKIVRQPGGFVNWKLKPHQLRQQPMGLSTTDATTHVEAKTPTLCSKRAGESKGAQMNIRQQKGLRIAATSKITRKGKMWTVPSQTGNKKYTVALDPNSGVCTCPDYQAHRKTCKHIYAVKYVLQREGKGKKKLTLSEVPKIKRPTYKQEWPAYNKAQTHEKSQLQALLCSLCNGLDEPAQMMGRPRHRIGDIIFSVVFKVYAGVSGRRIMTDLREAHMKGYLIEVPSYNSLFDYLEMETLTPYLRELITQSSLPLASLEEKFSVDSSGFRIKGFTPWFNARYGHEQENHDWIKLHIVCGCLTHVVVAVMTSERHANDSPFFKPLVTSAARAGFALKEISADKAYSSRGNLRLVKKVGATPYIPFKDNARGDGKCDYWNQMFHYYNLHREEFMEHYHKRSNVESTFSMIKAKFGEELRSKTKTAQMNEALCKILCHNLCCLIQSIYEFGVEPTFRAKSHSARKVSYLPEKLFD